MTVRLFIIGMLAAMSGMASAQMGQNTTTSYQYDANGNLILVTDPLSRVTHYAYDALNRRISTIDPAQGLTQYGYDGADHLVSVTDARHLVTQYTIDGLGNLLQTTSPDIGNTVNAYDDAGNLVSRTDAKGQTTTYQYDPLNRPTSITYADGSSVTYTYDQGPNALGRLSSIADSTGTIQYIYDWHGRIITETRIVGGQYYVTDYRYDSFGRLSGIQYPTSHREISYERDNTGRINRITSTKDGVTQVLVSGVAYQPFGPVQAINYGTSQSHVRTFDLDGRITGYTLASQFQSISYDAASRITAINDFANLSNPSRNINYAYDDLDRLISAVTPVNGMSYTYDPVGNRTSYANGAVNTSYTYGAANNQLKQVAGSQVNAIIEDPNGSIVNNGNNQFTYDARGRMISADTAIGLVQYQINALGQRVQKITPTATTVFHYDISGKLIAETTGNFTTEYVYLGDMPVAMLK